MTLLSGMVEAFAAFPEREELARKDAKMLLAHRHRETQSRGIVLKPALKAAEVIAGGNLRQAIDAAAVLQQITQRLQHVLRGDDTLARLGGDEAGEGIQRQGRDLGERGGHGDGRLDELALAQREEFAANESRETRPRDETEQDAQ